MMQISLETKDEHNYNILMYAAHKGLKVTLGGIPFMVQRLQLEAPFTASAELISGDIIKLSISKDKNGVPK